MRSLSNRIIKLRQPIKKVTVLPLQKEPDEETDRFDENLSSKESPEEYIQIARSDLDREIQFSYDKGLEEGKILGYQKAEEDFRSKLENLTRTFQQFEVEKQNFFRKSEQLLIDFTLKLTEKILGEVPRFLSGFIARSVKKVLDILGNEAKVEVYLNPQDMEDFKELHRSFERALPNAERIVVKPDERITRGGCVVDTENGKIDARIETQVQTLIQELRKELGHFSGEGESA